MLRSGDVPQGITGDRPIELVRLYVLQASLGSGVGAAFDAGCIDEAKQRGIKRYGSVFGNITRAPRRFTASGISVRWERMCFQLGDDPQTDMLIATQPVRMNRKERRAVNRKLS